MSTLFNCPACSRSLPGPEMLSHLQSSGHKTLIHVPTDEILQCEKCRDTNISSLVLMKYGQLDMVMLCQSCYFDQEQRPGIPCTMKNGTILKNVDAYFKAKEDKEYHEVMESFNFSDAEQDVDVEKITKELEFTTVGSRKSGKTGGNEGWKSYASVAGDAYTDEQGFVSVKTKKEKKDVMISKKYVGPGHEEFECFSSYRYRPRSSYDNLNDFFNEMCFHLYLEQKLETEDHITEFTTELYLLDGRLSANLVIPYTKEIQDLVDPRMRELGMLPFFIGQAIFLVDPMNRQRIWEFNVQEVELIQQKNGNRLEVFMGLYKWNNPEDFPMSEIGSYSGSEFEMMPASSSISRSLVAMDKLSSPQFKELLLGQKEVEHVFLDEDELEDELYLYRDSLNDSQVSAIHHALNNPITVIQGPPGTGKTATIHEMILQFVDISQGAPVLVVAQSNIAVDNIAEKLMENKNINVMRIVSASKEREYNKNHHLAKICLHVQVYDKLAPELQQVYLDLLYERGEVEKNEFDKLRAATASLRRELNSTSGVDVICTTTVTAGSTRMQGFDQFSVVIMDEATQSSQASSLIPMSLKGVDKFVFVGDQKQLSSFSEIPYLKWSMFERMLTYEIYRDPHMLDVQYRMHPALSAWPSKVFYDRKLMDGITEDERYYPGVQPLTFLDYGSSYLETRINNKGRDNSANRGEGYTYTNQGEAELVVRILKHFLFEKKVGNKNISVITPYAAQRDLVASLIQRDTKINPKGRPTKEEIQGDVLANNKPATIKTIEGIMVSSIDAFQGREVDFVIFGCVRSNGDKSIGFVRDAKRMNVALTRARNGLVVVGNRGCLMEANFLWKKFIVHLVRNNCIKTEKQFFT